MQTFKPRDLQSNLGSVFNAVQAGGEVIIDSRSRPNMILMLESEKSEMASEISRLVAIIEDFDLGEHIEIRDAMRKKFK